MTYIGKDLLKDEYITGLKEKGIKAISFEHYEDMNLSILEVYKVYQKLTDVGIALCTDIEMSKIVKVAENEKKIFSERCLEGINLARQEGSVAGRPKITDEKIREIRALRKNRNSFREIATKVDVSIGTVYKYSK